jgi:hypothetical protein
VVKLAWLFEGLAWEFDCIHVNDQHTKLKMINYLVPCTGHYSWIHALGFRPVARILAMEGGKTLSGGQNTNLGIFMPKSAWKLMPGGICTAPWFLIWPTFQGHGGQGSMLPLVGTSGYYWWPRIEYSNLVWTFILAPSTFLPNFGPIGLQMWLPGSHLGKPTTSYYSWGNGWICSKF